MQKSLPLTIKQRLDSFRLRWIEEPQKIWLGRPGNGYDTRWFGLSNSLWGVAYVIVSEHKCEDYVLRVNGEIVAKERLGIFLWMVENAPRTLEEAVRISLDYEKEHAVV